MAIASDTIAIAKAKAMVALNFVIKSFLKFESYAKFVMKKNIIFYIKGKLRQETSGVYVHL